jgi:MOSC domain-containing protein YiiM
MRTYEQLVAAWDALPPVSAKSGSVELVCVRREPGVHECPQRIEVSAARGLAGDRWATGPKPDPDAQVTLMSIHVARLVAGHDIPLDAAGDNLLVDLNLAAAGMVPGTRIAVGPQVVLEVTAKPHTGCKKFRERFGMDALRWVNEGGGLGLRGINCRVIGDGVVSVGDPVRVLGPRR